MDCLACPRANSPGSGLRTVSAGRVLSLIDMSRQALSAARRAVGEPGNAVTSSVHVTAGGDSLVSSSATAGNEGDVILRGTIAAFPVALRLRLTLAGAVVGLELSVSQPFMLGPIAWRFELLGPVSDTASNIVSAAAVAAAVGEAGCPANPPDRAMVAEAQLGAWRFLNRVGNQVLPTLAQCLPSLAAGADAYVACVVARLGTHDAAIIAEHLLGDDLTDTRRAV
ncbi:MAG TPA: hypothetical protein VHY37_05755 [Tepidisphaeraceae bacterium]|jgi:hypothetical protein|nr:hypothetical protein [Tepidisphaeraceae bacterium]